MVDAVDAVLSRYSQPPFYSERRLHFSVAWSLEALSFMPPSSSLEGFEVSCDTATVRIGERVTSLKLG
eukprot:542096-Prymnesium_polylepis.1